MSKREELKEKFKTLQRKKLQIEQDNKKDLFQEHQEQNQPSKKQLQKYNKAQKLLQQQQTEQEAASNDLTTERLLNRHYTLEEVEKWNQRLKEKEKRKEEGKGFGTWEEANLRKHEKLIEKLKVQQEDLDPLQEASTERQLDRILYLSEKNPKEKIKEMADDLKKQLEKRKKHSRKRDEDESEDVLYINDRNKNFNQKVARFYDKYTQEIRDNFERGTAL